MSMKELRNLRPFGTFLPEKLFYVYPNLVSHLPECPAFFFIPALGGGRIGKPHVQPSCSSEKNRAAFIRLIAKGDYIIKTLLKNSSMLLERWREISIPISRITFMATG